MNDKEYLGDRVNVFGWTAKREVAKTIFGLPWPRLQHNLGWYGESPVRHPHFPVAQPIVILSGGTWRWLVMAALVMVELTWAAWLGVSADLSLKWPVIILATVLAAISFIFRRLNFHDHR